MKRFLGYLLVTICLQALGVLFSSLLFLVIFAIRMGAENAVAAPGFFVLLSIGFCLVGYSVRGLFIAAVAAAFVGFRNPVLPPVLSALCAALVFYYFFGEPGFSSPRDGSLFAAGVSGYAIATFVIQRFLARRKRRGTAEAPDAG